MSISKSPAHLAFVAGLLVLHFALRPLLVVSPVGPDLLTGGLLLAALGIRAGLAAVLGIVLGLLEASMALTGMGATMLVYALAGFVAARSRDLLFSDSPTFVPTFIVVGVCAVQLVLAFSLDGAVDVRFALLWAPATAITTAIIFWLGERAVSYLSPA